MSSFEERYAAAQTVYRTCSTVLEAFPNKSRHKAAKLLNKMMDDSLKELEQMKERTFTYTYWYGKGWEEGSEHTITSTIELDHDDIVKKARSLGHCDVSWTHQWETSADRLSNRLADSA